MKKWTFVLLCKTCKYKKVYPRDSPCSDCLDHDEQYALYDKGISNIHGGDNLGLILIGKRIIQRYKGDPELCYNCSHYKVHQKVLCPPCDRGYVREEKNCSNERRFNCLSVGDCIIKKTNVDGVSRCNEWLKISKT